MKIIMFIVDVMQTFWEKLLKEEDVEQDFRRNYSERYSYSNNTIKKFL